MSVLNEVDQNTIDIIEKDSDDLFFDLIKAHPCLYDKKLPDYHDKIVVENALEDIAFVMQETVETCEQRWKQFQSAYQREKMLQERENRSGSAAPQRKPWPFYERMKSLYSCNTYRNTYTNVNDSTKEKRAPPATDYPRRKKRKQDEMISSAYSNVQNQLNAVMQLIQKENVPDTVKKSDSKNTGAENDCNALVGKLIATRLNELTPTSAKKKRKQIMQSLIDEDSE